ncbi:hypothetical protein BV455_03521 [Parageobacillus caldoxylosilyticus]|nr:hypothetical protein [Parageobacillus caldoxylosilyticus]QXJ40148.1 hypothetical protein BV455_03521 [Parageobacillus caldoxylosilyticus]
MQGLIDREEVLLALVLAFLPYFLQRYADREFYCCGLFM